MTHLKEKTYGAVAEVSTAFAVVSNEKLEAVFDEVNDGVDLTSPAVVELIVAPRDAKEKAVAGGFAASLVLKLSENPLLDLDKSPPPKPNPEPENAVPNAEPDEVVVTVVPKPPKIEAVVVVARVVLTSGVLASNELENGFELSLGFVSKDPKL